MSIRIWERRFSAITWYRQAGAVKPWYVGYPWNACFHFTVLGKPAPVSYSGLQTYLRHDYFDVYFDRQNMHRIAYYYFRRQQKKPHFIGDLKHYWRRTCIGPWQKYVPNCTPAKLWALTDAELVERFAQFSQLYKMVWSESIFLDAFDAMSDEILGDALRREGRTIAESDVHTLTAATSWSWLQRETAGLLDLCAAAKRTPKLARMIVRGESLTRIARAYPRFFRQLSLHSSTYRWIANDYAIVHRLEPRTFLKRIRELLENPERYRSERHGLAEVRHALARKRALRRRLRLSRRLAETFDFFVALSSWRDDRKAYNQMANEVLFDFGQEFQRRSGWSPRQAEYVFWWEAPEMLGNSRTLRRQAAERYRGTFYVDEPTKAAGSFTGAAGRRMRRLIERIAVHGRQLQGKPAFPGLVSGRARLIRSQHDFGKMKRGDILIAPNTRPEYVPIMKLAGAIITEEGGITSHAAIVSRELKVPCIVGMQGALNRLADGDRVEVDATKGVVRKL